MSFKTILLLSSCIFVSCVTTTPTEVNFKKYDDFKPKSTYKPLNIQVNFIFLQENNGNGSFNSKDSEQQEIIKFWQNKINFMYQNLKPTKNPKCNNIEPFIEDSKIQFNFNDFYIKNSFARNYLNNGYIESKKNYHKITPKKDWWLDSLDQSINDTISQKGINVYFTLNADSYEAHFVNSQKFEGKKMPVLSTAASQFPSFSDLKRTSQVNMPNQYYKYLWMKQHATKAHKANWETVKKWYLNEYIGIGHELGHSLNLKHYNKFHGTNQCKESIMNQSGNSRNYLPASEVIAIHKTISNSNLIQFIASDQTYQQDKILSQNTEINSATFRFYQNITLNENVHLKLKGHIIMPDNSLIKLKKGAKIQLEEGAKITYLNGDKFSNFDLDKKAEVYFK